MLLVQNCAESAIDVAMALHLPGADAKKQRDRFIRQEPSGSSSPSKAQKSATSCCP